MMSSEVIVMAEELKKRNNLEGAIKVYSKWLHDNGYKNRSSRRQLHSKGPDSDAEAVGLIYNNRGHLKYLKVDFDGALEDYNLGIKYDVLLPCVYYNRGTVFYRMGYFEKAVMDMLVATRLSPKCVDFHLGFYRTVEQLQKVQMKKSADLSTFVKETLHNSALDEVNVDTDGVSYLARQD